MSVATTANYLGPPLPTIWSLALGGSLGSLSPGCGRKSDETDKHSKDGEVVP